MAGRWAVITGASSGIGKALAFEFAAGGFDLVLVARNDEALRQVAAECRERHNVDAEIVLADLSSREGVERAVAEIQAKPGAIEALVNNAGFGIHGEFATSDIDENIRLLDLQLMAALRLTRAVLPGMVERRRGRIVNVGSVYSYSPVPFQSVYAACKAFLLSFSSALQNEVAGSGVTVSVFCPGITQTNFRARARIAEKKSGGMAAETAAGIAYRAAMGGKHIVVPGLTNRLYVFASRLLPSQAVPNMIRFINRLRGHRQS